MVSKVIEYLLLSNWRENALCNGYGFIEVLSLQLLDFWLSRFIILLSNKRTKEFHLLFMSIQQTILLKFTIILRNFHVVII